MGTKLGQVFLHDTNILAKIIESAQLNSEIHSVEIGCGDGILTQALLAHSRQVTVFEIDETCIDKTRQRIGTPEPLTFIHGDFLDTAPTLSELVGPLIVVANVPYYITSPIIKTLISYINQIERIILMVQKEFAEKLIAPPGSSLYTSFSVYARAHFAIDKLFNVSRTCFYPIPNVDSAVIRLRPNPISIPGDRTLFFAMVHSGFWGRRKPFLSALRKSPFITVDARIKSCPFFVANPSIRAETLSLDEFIQIFDQINSLITLSNTSAVLPH
ncbi:ribosomal RNA small subunit methyltransferase A [bacterium]|nr:ribosomal RNA small subunit methyltransferase A [bacterium]